MAAAVSLVLAGALAMAGCATSGPLHIYSLGVQGDRNIVDYGQGGTVEVPSFLEPEDALTGFAYDPFTDHFFLRLEPGNLIRVVDRPARAIKREFTIEGAPAKSRGDLAVRPRDGHLFLLVPEGVMETTRFGKLIRTIPLEMGTATATGIAFDPLRDRLLVLGPDGRNVTVHDLQGARVGEIKLAQAVRPSMGFHAEERQIHAPLRERNGEIGIFDETGALLRSTPPAGDYLDVGIRSFVRVF